MEIKKPTIVAKNLIKKFGDFTAVQGINFDVYPGEIFGFLGPNGSGKTTTIRMTLGLLQPTHGEVEVLGMKINGETEKIRPRVGYMSQKFSLYNDLTVSQNLNFYGAAYGLHQPLLEERIKDAVSMAGLIGKENLKTKELSGGWRQRLALSAAILHRPEVIFLDEPTAGVDPISRRAFWDLLYRLIAEKITVFVTTHYMDEAEHCHRLAFIQNGRIIAYGTPSEIKNNMIIGKVLEIAPSDPIKTINILRSTSNILLSSITEIELYGTLVHILAPDIQNLKDNIFSELEHAGINVHHFAFIEPSLEDVFIASMKMESSQP